VSKAVPIIQVHNLSKQFRIGRSEPYRTLREAIVRAVRAPFRRSGNGSNGSDTTIWALRDVSFDVEQGEVVGIIGRNGAGKSTLLKILSRITEPTTGHVDLHGRVGSLLEVGTGFHPELSGRENVFLNGAILGMTRAEITRKFDEIAAFSEIERFLDTPVKRYSSGMYMRLAFAVAAHLDPEILIVDEVLAVGDAAFQKKCLGKMSDVASHGRTVLFVSHNMPAVRSLCTRAIVLEEGRVAMRGSAGDCVAFYLRQSESPSHDAQVRFDKPSSGLMWMTSATLLCNGTPSTQFMMGDSLSIRVEFSAASPLQTPRLGALIVAPGGDRILNANNRFLPTPEFAPSASEGTIICDCGVVPLVQGRYSVWLHLGDQAQDIHVCENALSFEVTAQDIWGQGQVPPSNASPLWWPARFQFERAAEPSTAAAASAAKASETPV
jgi:lipopolysaccharide transport system ATP-binding protein